MDSSRVKSLCLHRKMQRHWSRLSNPMRTNGFIMKSTQNFNLLWIKQSLYPRYHDLPLQFLPSCRLRSRINLPTSYSSSWTTWAPIWLQRETSRKRIMKSSNAWASFGKTGTRSPIDSSLFLSSKSPINMNRTNHSNRIAEQLALCLSFQPWVWHFWVKEDSDWQWSRSLSVE